MMMSCPRCGFSQPADRFCAQCGLDVASYHPKSKPLWLRFIQNPTLHLTLIAALIVFAIGYIFYSQRELLGHEVGNLLSDIPLLSREASTGDKNLSAEAAGPMNPAQASTEKSTAATETDGTDSASASTEPAEAKATSENMLVAPGAPDAGSTDPAAKAPANDLEVSFWEVPHDLLVPILTTAEKTSEVSEGRVLVWTKPDQAVKVLETVDGGAQRLEGGKSFGVYSSPITVEDGAEGTPLQFSLKVDASKATSGDFNLKFGLDWRLPAATPEATATAAAIETSFESTATLATKGMIMIVFEPQDRTIKADLLKGATGPLSVFSSEEFRTGATDWIALIHSNR